MTRREAIGIALTSMASAGKGSPQAHSTPEKSRNILYSGTESPPSRQIPLKAGPLTMIFEPELAQLRYVKLGNKEVLRAVYAAVRDQNWGTVTPRITDLKTETTDNAFAVSFNVACVDGPIDVLWRGMIRGDAKGTIRFEFDAEARSTFLRNRLGFCVLHPIEGCSGQPVVIGKVDGSTERGLFPALISPHQPFKNIRSIRHTLQNGLDAEVSFTGDTFEMEDHRNWTDASFKTYCTPLDLPFPVEVKKGARVQQSVTLRLHGKPPRVSMSHASPEIRIEVHEGERTATPKIGLGVATDAPALTGRQVQRLRALAPAHLRVDLSLDRADWSAMLARAVQESKQLSAPLEIALTVGDRQEAELIGFAAALENTRIPVTRYLVFHRNDKSTTAATMDVARRFIKRADPNGLFSSGTDAYFTELNRGRPPVKHSDAVCYSVNPQVHAFDNASLVETLAMQGETVRSARSFCGLLPIAVTPVTLKPRSNPNATAAPAAGTGVPVLPEQVDPRQTSLFAAGWTIGSVKYLAEAGAASITYYETIGWRGVMESEKGSPLPALFPSRPSEVFPLYHSLADIGEFAAGDVIRTLSSDPLRADALLLRDRGRVRLLLANLSSQLQQVRIANGIFGKAVRVKRLDEHSAATAMANPETFRKDTGKLQEVGSDGVLTIALLPYSTATIDNT